MSERPKMITMSRLGRYGQWGNQVYQYAFIRTYAKRYGLEYQVPAWSGQYFFGHNDPPVSCELPQFDERYATTQHQSCFGKPYPPDGDSVVGHDWVGWAQYDTWWYAPDRDFILSLFDSVEPERTRMQAALAALKERGNTIIGLHLRRGDGGRLIFFWTPMVWILRWLRNNWLRFDKPVLYIATEDTSLVRYFDGYAPVTMETLGFSATAVLPPNYSYPHDRPEDRPRQLTFFPDWYLLQHSDVVLASESTFSVSAAWVSRTNREFWRPLLSLQDFEQVDPWNASVSPREHLDDYPGIPGTQIDENPDYAGYWRDYRSPHQSVPEDPEEIAKWIDPPSRM
jgi:hypothetical protein